MKITAFSIRINRVRFSVSEDPNILITDVMDDNDLKKYIEGKLSEIKMKPIIDSLVYKNENGYLVIEGLAEKIISEKSPDFLFV